MLREIYDFFAQDIPVIVRETLRAIGLDWRDDDPLNRVGLAQVISRMTGITFRDVFDPQIIREDIISEIGNRIHDATGFRPASFEPAELRQGFSGFVMSGIKDNTFTGPALRIVTQAQHVAWDAKRLGFEFAEEGWSVHLRRWNWREGQKKYLMQHKQAWVLQALWVRQYSPRVGKFGPWKHVASKKKIWYTWKRNQMRWKIAISENKPFLIDTVKSFVSQHVPATTQYASSGRKWAMPEVPYRTGKVKHRKWGSKTRSTD